MGIHHKKDAGYYCIVYYYWVLSLYSGITHCLSTLCYSKKRYIFYHCPNQYNCVLSWKGVELLFGRVLAHSLNLEVSFIHSQGSEQSSCICTIYMFIIRMGIERKATPCILQIILKECSSFGSEIIQYLLTKGL